MAIDFRLTGRQHELQLYSRKFASEVLSPALAAEALPTPEQRFAATKSAYEATIAAGFLRKCIPLSAGGENAGLTDTAIMIEELYAVNASVTLTLIGTVLGLLPLLIGGTEEQRSRLLPPFLKQAGAPLAGFCATKPGGSANAASPPPGEGVRTTATLRGDRWIIEGRKSWVSSATGWDRKGADILSVLCRTDPDAPPERGISVMVVERPASGLVFERAIDSVGHRAHLLPVFGFEGVSIPSDNVLGSVGGGLTLTAACFTGAAALVGIFAVALMRAGLSSRWVSPAAKGEAAFTSLSNIKPSDTRWRTQRRRSRPPAVFAGGRARRSTCNRLARRSWRSQQKSMVRKRPCACSRISCGSSG